MVRYLIAILIVLLSACSEGTGYTSDEDFISKCFEEAAKICKKEKVDFPVNYDSYIDSHGVDYCGDDCMIDPKCANQCIWSRSIGFLFINKEDKSTTYYSACTLYNDSKYKLHCAGPYTTPPKMYIPYP